MLFGNSPDYNIPPSWLIKKAGENVWQLPVSKSFSTNFEFDIESKCTFFTWNFKLESKGIFFWLEMTGYPKPISKEKNVSEDI